MKCHQILNIPVSDLIENTTDIPRLLSGNLYGVSNVNPKLFLKTGVYEKLSMLGKLTSLVFEMKPNTDKGSIHVDLITSTLEPAWSGLNILIEGQGTMKWFQPESAGHLIIRENPKTATRTWFKNYGEAVDIWDTGKVALVRTDIPHQAWNYSDTNRFIVSIRWSIRTTWEETIEWFKNNKIEE